MNRQENLIQILLKAEKPLTTQELAEQLNVSSRTIRSDLEKIESETSVRVSSKKARKKNISLEILRQPNQNLGEEGYLLNISTTEIHIAANSYAGLFYGTQSLFQYIIANNNITNLETPKECFKAIEISFEN